MKLVAFVNRLSGGQMGSKIEHKLKDIKIISAVHDLSEGGPRAALTKYAEDNEQIVAICCGGDGTFNWVASTVLDIQTQFPAFKPDIVPCPLGTGNDLARTLGWGVQFPGFNHLERFAQHARNATAGPEIDMWKVHFASSKPKLPQFQNYFSIGVDAEIARRFDVMRNAHPERFRSQTKNKIRYALLGAKAALEGAPSLDIRIKQLIIGGREVKIPAGAKAIVVLNIPSYSAGAKPWGFDHGAACLPPMHKVRKFHTPAINDGLLEVICLSGVLEAGLLQNKVSLSKAMGYHAKRLGQGHSVEIAFENEAGFKARRHSSGKTYAKNLSAQVDGEAWAFPWAEERVTLTHGARVGTRFGPLHVEGHWPSAHVVKEQPHHAAAQAQHGQAHAHAHVHAHGTKDGGAEDGAKPHNGHEKHHSSHEKEHHHSSHEKEHHHSSHQEKHHHSSHEEKHHHSSHEKKPHGEHNEAEGGAKDEQSPQLKPARKTSSSGALVESGSRPVTAGTAQGFWEGDQEAEGGGAAAAAAPDATTNKS